MPLFSNGFCDGANHLFHYEVKSMLEKNATGIPFRIRVPAILTSETSVSTKEERILSAVTFTQSSISLIRLADIDRNGEIIISYRIKPDNKNALSISENTKTALLRPAEISTLWTVADFTKVEDDQDLVH